MYCAPTTEGKRARNEFCATWSWGMRAGPVGIGEPELIGEPEYVGEQERVERWAPWEWRDR